MTHWRRPRGLTADELARTADDLRALADELTAEHALQVQRLIEVEADPTWPAATSGTGTGGGAGGGSPVERAVTDTDRDSGRALTTIGILRQLARLAPLARSALLERSPGRAVALCPRCGHPLDRRYQRCQQIIDGVQCGSRAGAERRCSTCDEVQPPGQPLRNGECDACRKHRRRTGRARVATSMLALRQGLIEEGTYIHG